MTDKLTKEQVITLAKEHGLHVVVPDKHIFKNVYVSRSIDSQEISGLWVDYTFRLRVYHYSGPKLSQADLNKRWNLTIEEVL